MIKMLNQFYKGGSLKLLDHEKLNEVLNKFETLPLWFMKFHSASDIDEVKFC